MKRPRRLAEKIGVVATVIGTIVAVLLYFGIAPWSNKNEAAVAPSNNPAIAAIDQRLATTREIAAPAQRDQALSDVAGLALQADLPRKAIEIAGMMVSSSMKDRTLERVVQHAIVRRDFKLAEETAKSISQAVLRDRALRQVVERQR